MINLEVDLHGFELWEALEEIVYKLEECKTRGIREIVLVHGFHRGQILKNYIQSESAKKWLFILHNVKESNAISNCFFAFKNL